MITGEEWVAVGTPRRDATASRAGAATLPLERRIGQLLMVAFPGPTLGADLAAFIAEAGIGGVLLFGDNVVSPWQARELTAALQNCAAAAGLPPLFIAVDQEGGAVSRLRYPITTVPSPMAIAATGNVAHAAGIAGVLAAELHQLGLNLNLATVVDVNTHPQNPVIGTRAYGDAPERVAAFAAAAITAHHRHGVLVAAKHFPGHGATTLDSHHELPAVDHDWPRMRAVELPPFAAAIAAGVDAVLTAHVVYPKIDPSGLPATLSRPLLEDLLRRQLGFEGIVISDAIEMNAIARRYGQVEGALRGVAAGVDVVLSVGRLAEQREMHRALLQAVRGGRLAEERVDAALGRILRAKARLQNGPADAPDEAEPWPKHGHQLIARQVARESITIVRDEGALLPLRPHVTQRLGLVEFRSARSSPVVGRDDGLSLLDLLVRARHGNTASLLIDCSFRASVRAARQFAECSDLLLLATRDAVRDPAQATTVQELLGLGKPAAVLALCSPYDLLAFPAAPCYVASYGDQSCSLEAAVSVLFGDFTPAGQLPVRLEIEPAY